MPADGSRQKSSGGPMSTEREDIKKIEKENKQFQAGQLD